jgi:hypothetical protein
VATRRYLETSNWLASCGGRKARGVSGFGKGGALAIAEVRTMHERTQISMSIKLDVLHVNFMQCLVESIDGGLDIKGF